MLYFKTKMHQIQFRLGLRHIPRWGSSLSWISGVLLASIIVPWDSSSCERPKCVINLPGSNIIIIIIWDVTVASTLAASYADIAATGAGLVAGQAADRKADKYVDFPASYVFEPIAVENLGPPNASALEFISNLGQRISNLSGDDRETQFLFQRISVTIQRFNLVLLHDSFSMDPPDQ